MKRTKLYAFTNSALVIVSLALSSCGTDPQSPGIEYMPDMYRTRAMEPYAKNDHPVEGTSFQDNMEALKPADGSIARGYLPYGIPNTNEGYEMAGRLLKNPFPSDEATIEAGKEIYTKYCVHCHGKEGAGDGPTVSAGGHPPPPAYNSAALINLTEGKMFHTITYGKNLMGSHSSQLTVEDRWKVIRYVQTLQNPEGEAEDTENAEEENSEENTGGETDPAAEAEMEAETALNN